MPDALPAVTVPSGLNTGFSLPRPSTVASGRTCSSRANSVGALLRLQLDRHDLLVEQALLLRARRAPVRLDRELVLLLAADAVRLGEVLRRDAHVDLVERVGEAADDRVDHLRVAHARAPAGVRHPVGAAAHRLGAAGDGDVGIARRDRLRGGHDRLHAGAAQAVDRERGHLLRDARPSSPTTRAMYMSSGAEWITLPNTTCSTCVGLDSGALERRPRRRSRPARWAATSFRLPP